MEENKYERLFEVTKHNLTTLLLGRPVLYYLNTFGYKDIKMIRDKHYEYGFKQCFLIEKEIDHQNLFVVYNNKETIDKNSVDWDFFKDSIVKSKHYVDEYIIDENTFAFKIKFPLKWHKDFEAIVNGKYSQVSNEYLNAFYANKSNLLFHLKHKTPEAISFFSKKFHVKPSVFDDCEIGQRMHFTDEELKIDNKILI